MKKLPWKKLFLVTVFWRLSLFIISLLADKFLSYAPSFPYAQELLANLGVDRWIYSWGNFDGVHYLTIANKGYLGTGLIQAFFPVFPLILSSLQAIFGQYFFWLALLCQFLTTCLLSGLIFYLVKEILHKTTKVAWLTVLLLLIFPTSFFLAALYNEGLFLVFVLSSFISAHHKKWWLAGIFGALAAATRVVGIAIWLALIIDWWLSKNTKLTLTNLGKVIKINWLELLGLSLSSLGLISYMVYLNQVFHDPLYFFHVQSEFGAGRQEGLILLPQVIWRYLKILTTVPIDWKFYAYAQEFILSVLAFAILLINWRKTRLSYLIFALLVITIPTLTGTFSSMPRYVMVAWPLYYLLAEWLNNKPKTKSLIFTLSLILLIINTLLFIQGYWVS